MNPLLLVFLAIAGLILVLGLALVLFQRRVLRDQQAQVREIIEEMQQIAAEEREGRDEPAGDIAGAAAGGECSDGDRVRP